MNYVGLDLSLTGTGIVILDSKGELISAKTLSSKPKERRYDDAIRMHELSERILAEIPKECLVGIEAPAFMVRNATALVQLGALSYYIRVKLWLGLGLPYIMVAPTTVKKFATGVGKGDKDKVMMEVYRNWGFAGDDNNQSDAFVLAKIMYHMENDYKSLTKERKETINLLKKQYE